MARTSMESTVKFRVLVRRIAIAEPFVRGLLETMWDVCHASGSPILGDPFAVETASKWPGEVGAWFAVLRDGGWIEQLDDGRWRVHDYWDHAPSYVAKREARNHGIPYQEFVRRAKEKDDGQKQKQVVTTNGLSADSEREPMDHERDKEGIDSHPPDSERNPLASECLPFSSESLASPDQTRPDKAREEPPQPPLRGGDAAETADAWSSAKIPESLDTPEFRAAWTEWRDYRSEARKPLKKRSVSAQLKYLAGLGPAAAVKTIERSIRNGWTGLFAGQDGPATRAPPAGGPDRAVRVKALIERNQAAAKGGGEC